MSKLSTSATIAAAGLATSLITAFAVTLVDRLIGLNLFTLSIWVVIPAGAGMCGFAAASGYYLAAKWLHQRPTKVLLVQMVIIAALTQFLIYWFEYQTLVVDGVAVPSVLSFSQYLDITLTSSHLRIGRAGQADAGEVGSFGYWLAVFQFIGFLVGGVIVYVTLQNQPTCHECNKYLREATKKADSFADIDAFAPYYDHVYSFPVDSEEFRAHVGREFSAGKAQQGTINLTTTIYECPKCFDQQVRERVQVFNGRDWKDVNELARFVKMPSGVDVRTAFNA